MSSRRSSRATSTPSIFGRPRSSTTTSGRNAFASSSAAWPSAAIAHLVALESQRALEDVGDVAVVLDDEHPGGAIEIGHCQRC